MKVLNFYQISLVTKEYPNGFVAIKNINMTIGQHKIYGLIGPNGSGKTGLSLIY